jgi:hypothetical protein
MNQTGIRSEQSGSEWFVDVYPDFSAFAVCPDFPTFAACPDSLTFDVRPDFLTSGVALVELPGLEDSDPLNQRYPGLPNHQVHPQYCAFYNDLDGARKNLLADLRNRTDLGRPPPCQKS